MAEYDCGNPFSRVFPMLFQTLPALFLFCLVATITPGPNNLMVMASGANFGYRRTLPHMLGVAMGFAAMTLLVGLGLMQVFQAFPLGQKALTLACVLYLLWLAWKIAHAAPPASSPESAGHPFRFLQAAGFQWINPKAWTVTFGAITLYAPDQSLAAIGLIALLFAAISMPSLSLWTLIGQQVRRLLGSPRRLAVFNWSMAALLVASLYPVFFH